MRTAAVVLLSVLGVLGPAGWAQAASVIDNAPFAHLKPVSDARLDALRGGFTISVGGVSVDLSMGLKQATYINGQLAFSSDLSGAAVPSQVLRVIQNGPGNVFNPGSLNLPPGTMATVIQNSLDKQLIQNINVLNVTVTSQALAHALSLQSALRDALTGLGGL